ncbi:MULTISPECIES: hypothetical protein [unclassified Streptomyces]|uniref:hypothetical protein n=1 Tax=unclassified Streptomyces TaxID=2593676 RepID=UPI000B8237D1|nr:MULTISPECIES: hypothetical protein [unclassified Streptomyces]MYS22114.1 hypothetical protein [Streptomyces sp. SID4948]
MGGLVLVLALTGGASACGSGTGDRRATGAPTAAGPTRPTATTAPTTATTTTATATTTTTGSAEPSPTSTPPGKGGQLSAAPTASRPGTTSAPAGSPPGHSPHSPHPPKPPSRPSRTPSARPATTRPPATHVPSAADLRAALLAVADVPDGFTRQTGPAPGSGDSSLAACPVLASDPKGASASASVVFADATGTSLSETLLQYTGSGAARAMAAYQGMPSACASFSGEVDGFEVSFRAAPLSLPAVGDQSTTTRFTGTIPALGAALYMDVRAIRHSGTVIVVSHDGLAVDTALTRDTAATAYRKAAARW